jgi:hypothetical protein
MKIASRAAPRQRPGRARRASARAVPLPSVKAATAPNVPTLQRASVTASRSASANRLATESLSGTATQKAVKSVRAAASVLLLTAPAALREETALPAIGLSVRAVRTGIVRGRRSAAAKKERATPVRRAAKAVRVSETGPAPVRLVATASRFPGVPRKAKREASARAAPSLRVMGATAPNGPSLLAKTVIVPSAPTRRAKAPSGPVVTSRPARTPLPGRAPEGTERRLVNARDRRAAANPVANRSAALQANPQDAAALANRQASVPSAKGLQRERAAAPAPAVLLAGRAMTSNDFP